MNTLYDYDQEGAKASLLKCNEVTLVGQLAADRSYYPTSGAHNACVTPIRNGSAIMFYVEVLSEEPQALANFRIDGHHEKLYIGLDHDQMKVIINDIVYVSRSESEKIAHWERLLKDKFIIFKPKIKAHGPIYLNIEILNLEEKMIHTDNPLFLSIPHAVMASASFEERLRSKNGYLLLDQYPHENPEPKYVVCGDYLYFNFKGWERHHTNSKAWKLAKHPENVLRADWRRVQKELEAYFVEAPNKLTFFNLEADARLKELLVKLGEPLFQTQRSHDSSETEFLGALKALAVENRLFYDDLDLLNFHVSLKSNPLTVVAGMSGIGKTKLARIYGKALGIEESEGRQLFLPISPSYLEPSDVLGRYSGSDAKYIPAETGLVELLIQAEKHPEQLYQVLFDEMNLSQVEHWFAPFLSLLELEKENRRLNLYSREAPCQNGDKYPPQVQIGDNIIFVGTVNLDDTTKEFSDRVLDRMNVVTLRKGRFSQMRAVEEKTAPAAPYSFDKFNSWRSQSLPVNAFTNQELEFFDDLHDMLNLYDSQKGVSFRFLNRLGRYIHNIPPKSPLTKAMAIDLGIRQGILTKLKGSERQIGSLVGIMESPGDPLAGSSLQELLQSSDVQQISTFSESQKELSRKALELGNHGYTG